MPLIAYNRLPEAKQEAVYRACKEEFEERPFHKAKVSHIVDKLGIARGSFYQYFEDLKDCYFYVLSKETVEIHELFFRLIKKGLSLDEALKSYEDLIVENLINTPNYKLYKNRYLYWNNDLDEYFKQVGPREMEDMKLVMPDPDLIHFLKALVHDLIYRLYSEEWDETMFRQRYRKALGYLRGIL